MNLLVLHAGALGDCVLAIQTARIVASAIHADRVEMVARSGIARWAAGRGLLQAAHSMESSYGRGLFEQQDDEHSVFAEFLRSFDHILSFLGGMNDPISTRLVSSSGKQVWAIDPRVREATQVAGGHITEQWLSDLAVQGCHVSRGSPPDDSIKPTSPAEFARCRDLFLLKAESRQDRSRVYLIHPGGGGRWKCLPLIVMERLLKSLCSSEAHVAWIIGPDEWERDGPDFVHRLERTAPVIYEESIEPAADILSAADLYIGHDAGMTHVAALAGVPTIALFGPTDRRVWKPMGGCCDVAFFPSLKEPMDSWIENMANLAASKARR
ncbi:MAG: glycosyltransferase family 9 protein [Planctomycetota bacterium]